MDGSELLSKRYRNDFPKDKEFDKLIKQVEDAIEAGVFPERNSKGSSGSYLTKTQQMVRLCETRDNKSINKNFAQARVYRKQLEFLNPKTKNHMLRKIQSG